MLLIIRMPLIFHSIPKMERLQRAEVLRVLKNWVCICKKLDMTVAKMGTTLYSGNVEASPLKGGKDSCEYCPYDSICAYHMSDCRNSFSLKNDEVCRILEEEQENGGEE